MRTRFTQLRDDVVVEPEDVLGVVLALHGAQALVATLAERDLARREVDAVVDVAGRERPGCERGGVRPGALDVRLVVLGAPPRP
jgi:hypothetical protein